MRKSESQNVEYKRSWHDEYLRWVCGFANAKGGTIWIGIDDDRSVVGVAHAKMDAVLAEIRAALEGAK